MNPVAALQRDAQDPALLAFDPDGTAQVLDLLRRAEALGGSMATWLVERAADRLDALRTRHAEAKSAAESATAALPEGGPRSPAHEAALEALAAGDLVTARQKAEAAMAAPAPHAGAKKRLARLKTHAAEAQVRLPDALAAALASDAADGTAEPVAPAVRADGTARAPVEPAPGPSERDLALSAAIANVLRARSRAEARATMAAATAAEHVPDAAGPLNPHAVAARLVERLAALSPDYLRELVGVLDAYGTLARLPAARAARKKRRKR